MKKLQIIFSFVMLLLLFAYSCKNIPGKGESAVIGDSLYMKDVPVTPGPDAWTFIEDLNSPLWTKHSWGTKSAVDGQADLSQGVTIRQNFPDLKSRLETAYNDLHDFFKAGDVPYVNGPYVIETAFSKNLNGESFMLEINPGSCRIIAGDAEGIRRGIFQIEEEMLKAGGPFLQKGTTEKHPFVKRRISRCLYGPIKRPPAMRDELMDEVDYYPDQYLNRIAHDGVNGIWITVEFRDLVSTKYTPKAGQDGQKKLDKLRRTVARCLRYGIKTYIFTIEPRAWGNLPPYYNDLYVLEKHPELGGVGNPDGEILDLKTQSLSAVHFCPMSRNAQDYLYSVVNSIFREVPGLGGMINISHGERTTTCASSIPEEEPYTHKIDCPRCSKVEPWDVLYTSLSAMKKGMKDAEPDAELISWLYHADSYWDDWVFNIPSRTPDDVILQLNFESGVTRTEFGKKLKGGDYWLATPGPSENFVRQAEAARKSGKKVSAKLQTGNSHEVATVPYVPVPSMIYRKFAAMHDLGVSHAMLGWYFGNYPGPMMRASGLLSFEPFPEDEDQFLENLASLYWKKEDVANVVKAWKNFATGYANYPLWKEMGYYGPMHDGPVWPLLLKPADAPLSPTWLQGSSFVPKRWPPSGDRIGECIFKGGYTLNGSMENVLTLEETVELCRRMSQEWNKGLETLNQLEPKYVNEPENILEIGVAQALGIQFRSGYNILRFYDLREKMFRMEGPGRLDILAQLENIIREELLMDEQLIKLCERDSRLGFHSEAEGYKYFPEKIRWRMQKLQDVLENDLPELRKKIKKDELLFSEYTGKMPQGSVAYSTKITGPVNDITENFKWQDCRFGSDTLSLSWSSVYNTDTLYIVLYDKKSISNVTNVTIKIEPRRLWLATRFGFSPDGNGASRIRVIETGGKKYLIAPVAFKSFWWSDEEMHPVRFDVHVRRSDGNTSSWCPYNPNLGTYVTYRTTFLTDKQADLGWLIFNE